MIKSELTSHLEEAAGISKIQAQKVVEAFQNAVINELNAGKSVELIGFGKFYLKRLPARGGFNLKTRERIVNPPTNTVLFKPSATLRKAITNA